MAKQQYTWSVRGVGSEGRDHAKKSSGKRRVTIGEWLSLALIALADEELDAAPDSLPPIGPSQAVADAAGLGDRERALLALATRPPPATTKAEHEQQAPWSVRGVSQVARVKAAQAAAHRRVTIGEWVNHAIITYADREAGIETPRPVAATPPSSEAETEKAMQMVEALARHIDETGSAMTSPRDLALETRPTAARIVATTPTAPAATATINAEITELSHQVKESVERNEARMTTLSSALTVFADRLKLTGGTGRPAADPAPQDRPTAAAPSPTTRTDDHMSETELAFWETIKDSDDPSGYEVYLETYPDGVFAPIARKRLNPGETTATPTSQPGDAATRRRPPVTSYPKLDFETLNQRAIENTRRLNPDKE
jgi:hypothetical protein